MGLLSYNVVSAGIILWKAWQCPQKVQPLASNFSFIFFFGSHLKKSLCHFQTGNLLFFSSKVPVLYATDFSTQHLWDTHRSMTGNLSKRRGDLENKLFTFHWRSGKHPLLACLHQLWWSCASMEFGRASFKSLFFHWLFARVYWKPEFYICFLMDFLSTMNTLFSYLAFTKPGLQTLV